MGDFELNNNKPQTIKALESSQNDALRTSLSLEPNTPLWQRVPTKDETGQYLGDFMMVIPGLKKKSAESRKQIINALSSVLEFYEGTVVFADLNMKMNLLWVSIKPVKGMMIEIPAAIIASVPEAKLISDRPPDK